MAGKLDPANMSKRYRDGVAGAGSKYADGINGTTVNPMQLAIQHKNDMIKRWNEAMNRGDWEAALNAVNPQTWKQNASTFGAQNYTASVAKGGPKYDKVATRLASKLAQVKAEIRAMPNGTEAERTARLNRSQELMKAIKGTLKG